MTLAILPIYASTSTVFAQGGISIEVSTEKESYNPGESIVVSGVVSPYIPEQDVILQVVSPRNNIVEVAQVEVDPYNGIFNTEIQTSIGGSWKQSGDYVIRAFYFDDGSAAQVFCTDWSNELSKSQNYIDELKAALYSKEFTDFLYSLND